MLYFNKLKRFILLLIFCIFVHYHVQSQGCVDTIVSKQFDVENFGSTFWGGTNYQDSLGNLYLTGYRYIQANPPSIAQIKSTLIKFNADKKIIWSKNYPGSIGFDDFAFGRRIKGQDTGNNLYFLSSGINIGGTSNFNNGNFLKTDSNGNILTNKILTRQSSFPQGYGFSAFISAGKIFSTIIAGYRIASFTSATFAALDKDLTTIRWSKSYLPLVSNIISYVGDYSIELTDTTAVTPIRVQYKNPADLTDTIHTFAFLEINSLKGNITNQKSYNCFNSQNPGKSISHTSPRAVNINYDTKEVIYQFSRVVNNSTIFSFIKIDENLNISQLAEFQANLLFNLYDFNKLNDSIIILNATFTENGLKKFATVYWNLNLQLILQRVYYSPQFTANASYTSLTSKNQNNTINYFIASQGLFAPGENPIYLFDNIKNPNFDFGCTDKDINLFMPVTASVIQPQTVLFNEQPGLNYVLSDNPNIFTAQNNSFTESKYCDFISICNSLKIQGKSSFCLNSGNIDSFKVDRNGSCLRKTKWSVNNTQMQILQSNDSVATVKFLQPFNGFIKAMYENCNVVDSFYIEVDTVYNVKTGVYLGNDTVQCIGKSITLNAGNGFKEYVWQDGSSLPTFTTSNTGLFHVTVKDSCMNIYKDSVYIQPNSQKLDLMQAGILCEYDTAKIILPNQFTNYLWQPAVNSLISGNSLFLFPTSTTVYTISAESHNNCRIEDTLLVKKKDCYGILYFPTAFSPNNDGINDSYRAGAKGILQSYQLSIFNRYGEMVFTTKDIATGWDGKYKGKLLAGAYTWVCHYTFRNRKAETETGSFILIR
ncbi:MAG: gliding motility-associated C-terminal domain-containing protein [Ferruginibacter sp.]